MSDVLILESGKKADLANAFHNEKIIVFDYTRSMEETVNYSILENFKNGYMFSAKYNSATKHFQACKVLCLANFMPDKAKLSLDRWMIFLLENDKLLLQ